MRTVAAAVLASLAVALPAAAQTFDGLGRFGTPDNPLPVDPFIEIDSAGSHTLRLSWGAFNAQGFTNYGIVSINAAITATDPGLAFSAQPGNRIPWVSNPFGNGSPGPGGISGIESARALAPVQVAVPAGSPQPEPPVFSPGLNSFADVYGFGVTITDLTPRDIPLSVLGSMRVISGWSVTMTPGGAEDVYTFTPNAFVIDDAATGSIILRIVPAPSAAALVALGAVAAVRRRRG